MNVIKSPNEVTHKSLAAIILTIILSVLAFYSNQVSASVAAWFGIIMFTIMAVLQIPGVASGKLPAGWTIMTILFNAFGVVLQVNTQIAEQQLLNPKITNLIFVVVNLVILTFIKEYTGVGGVTTISAEPTPVVEKQAA